jgi:hypothetical protein
MPSNKPAPPPTPGEQEFFTRAEVAPILRMSLSTLDRRIRDELVGAIKCGEGRFARVLIPRAALYAAIEARRRGEI